MQKKVLSFMKEYHMVEEGERILAAVSGGADSICLLKVLLELKQEIYFQLFVVHVEHGIRGQESLRDAMFVENFCAMHKIPCSVYHCKAAEYARDHKMTVEEGARTLRYGYFKEAAAEYGADKIAVAHNQNDCAETILFHLARGTGMKGLCGILPVREQIIRPLLCAEREEIEAYLQEQGQGFCRDETNTELDYTRNRIRHKVLPELKKINAQTVAHMNQTAVFAAQMQELLEELTQQAEEKYVRREAAYISIRAEVLEEKQVVYSALLHRMLAEAAESQKDISMIHVQQMQELFGKQVGKELYLPYGITGIRSYEGIQLKKREKHAGKEEKNCWGLNPGKELLIPEYDYRIQARILESFPKNQEIPKKMYTKWFDYDKINGSMLLRTRREEDYFIVNAQGGRKKIKKYLIDEKVPREQREHILLLADDTHVIWAVGYRIGEDVKVTEHTKRILEIQVDGGNIHE